MNAESNPDFGKMFAEHAVSLIPVFRDANRVMSNFGRAILQATEGLAEEFAQAMENTPETGAQGQESLLQGENEAE